MFEDQYVDMPFNYFGLIEDSDLIASALGFNDSNQMLKSFMLELYNNDINVVMSKNLNTLSIHKDHYYSFLWEDIWDEFVQKHTKYNHFSLEPHSNGYIIYCNWDIVNMWEIINDILKIPIEEFSEDLYMRTGLNSINNFATTDKTIFFKKINDANAFVEYLNNLTNPQYRVAEKCLNQLGFEFVNSTDIILTNKKILNEINKYNYSKLKEKFNFVINGNELKFNSKIDLKNFAFFSYYLLKSSMDNTYKTIDFAVEKFKNNEQKVKNINGRKIVFL